MVLLLDETFPQSLLHSPSFFPCEPQSEPFSYCSNLHLFQLRLKFPFEDGEHDLDFCILITCQIQHLLGEPRKKQCSSSLLFWQYSIQYCKWVKFNDTLWETHLIWSYFLTYEMGRMHYQCFASCSVNSRISKNSVRGSWRRDSCAQSTPFQLQLEHHTFTCFVLTSVCFHLNNRAPGYKQLPSSIRYFQRHLQSLKCQGNRQWKEHWLPNLTAGLKPACITYWLCDLRQGI